MKYKKVVKTEHCKNMAYYKGIFFMTGHTFGPGTNHFMKISLVEILFLI